MSDPALSRVVRCAIHVHTDASDGNLPIAEVVREAEEAGVDALLLTDHLRTADSGNFQQGRRGRVLVITGAEVHTRDGDHLLVFGTNDRLATRLLSTEDALQLLDRLGVLFFIAHPQGRPRRYFFSRRFAWDRWQDGRVPGYEVWSYMHDWIENCTPSRLPEMCRNPAGFVTGPHPDVIAAWDRLAEDRPVAGLGGLDTHGAQLPFGLGRVLDWARQGILPYQQNFKAFATYAMVPAAAGGDAEDIRNLLRALAAGRSWLCHDALACGKEARFWGSVDKRRLYAGSEHLWAPGARFLATVPIPARLRLMCRGECLGEARGQELELAAPTPGAYRLEALIEDRLWLITNHVRLLART